MVSEVARPQAALDDRHQWVDRVALARPGAVWHIQSNAVEELVVKNVFFAVSKVFLFILFDLAQVHVTVEIIQLVDGEPGKRLVRRHFAKRVFLVSGTRDYLAVSFNAMNDK